MGGRGSNSGGGGGGGGSAMSASMPTLSGSEKQVAWAEDIRSGALKSVDTLVANAKEGPNGLHAITANYTTGEKVSVAAAKTVRAEVVETLQNVTSAKMLIDNRSRFSFNAIENMMALEQRTGQISEARRRRKK